MVAALGVIQTMVPVFMVVLMAAVAMEVAMAAVVHMVAMQVCTMLFRSLFSVFCVITCVSLTVTSAADQFFYEMYVKSFQELNHSLPRPMFFCQV